MVDTRLQAVDRLRAMVAAEEELDIGEPPDEGVLAMYLTCANDSVDKAFQRMKEFYRLKELYSDSFAPRRDPNIHDVILKKGIHVMLKDRDQLGRRIYVIRFGNIQYGEFDPNYMFAIDDIWLMLASDEEETQKNGLVVLMDMAGMSWKLLRYFTPHRVTVGAAKAEALPLRGLQVHFINGGLLLNAVARLIIPFLSQATRESMFCHKTLEGLYCHVSPSQLPKDYGGEKGPIDPESLVKEYLDPRNSRLSDLLSYGYKRNGNRK